MKFIQVWIEGTAPLLQHRFSEQAEADVSKATRAVNIKYDAPRDAAEKCVYREEGTRALTIPGASFSRMLCSAGERHKQRGSRKSLAYVVPAALIVSEDYAPLYKKDRETRITEFEIDSRSVVIPATKGRVMRHRPKHNEWTCRFTLRLNEDVLAPETVRQLLQEGGQQVGVGDFRPQKRGPFGTFDIVSWEELPKN